MPKGKVKIMRKKIVDDDLAEMFNQLLGTGGTNLEFAWPRYQRLKKIAIQLTKLVSIINSCDLMSESQFDTLRESTASWVTSRSADTDFAFSMSSIGAKPLVAGLFDYESVTESNKNMFQKSYDACKKIPLFKHAAKWLAALEPHAKTLNTDPTTLAPGQPKPHTSFVIMAGAEWYPLDPIKINFKTLFTQCKNEKTLLLIMSVLKKTLEVCRELTVELRSPDIDVDKFVNIISENIDKLKKVPELSRCGSAFSKIKRSVGLLKQNFNTYYSDFVETSDSTIIMQHFVLDVAQNTKADAKTTQEFRKIMMYYRKVASQRGQNDPKVNSLFDKIEEKFGVLKNKGNEVEVEGDSDESLESIDADNEAE
jgi:hypothetical protein